ncbi:MAG: carboxypeptidase regulatory-like domain-containing protein [Gemmatimonadetes bacterium]|nr:carboxypeptidase regulatory-like domain-containing protein [Gemmatimonadota bacterium]
MFAFSSGRPSGSVLFAVLLHLCFASGAWGQSLTETEVSGRVRTALGEPIPRAVVSLLEPGGRVARTVESGLNGSFTIRGLQAGIYEVRIEALGFTSRWYTELELRPGVLERIEATLRAAGAAQDTVVLSRSQMSGTSGRWFDHTEFARLPRAEPTLSSWAPLSTLLDDELGMEGLPGRFTRVLIDGVAFRSVRPPGLRGLERGGGLLTARSLSALEVMASPWTAEAGVGGGGVLSAHSLRGSSSSVGVDGAVSAGGMRSAATDPESAPDALSYWGGGTATIVLSPDTAGLALSADAWQVERPRAGLLPGSGLGTEGTDEPYLERKRGFAGFARLDRMLDGGQQLWGSARLSMQPATTDLTGMAWGLSDAGERVDLLGALGLAAALGRRESLEARLSFSRSAWTPATETSVDLPFETGSPTLYDPARGLRAGPGPLTAGDVSRTDVDVLALLQVSRGAHRWKLGVGGGVGAHSQDWGGVTGGRAILSEGTIQNGWTGLVDAEVFERDVSESIPRLNAFVEDRWSSGRGLTLSGGVRIDSEWLPLGNNLPGITWLQQSGLTPPTLPEQVTSGGGFLGLTWAASEGTTITLNSSYSSDEVDPLLVGELLASIRFLATRQLSLLREWPTPIDPNTTTSGRRPGYAYAFEDLKGATTLRFSGGMAQTLAPGATLDAGVVYRRTEKLLRRRDLNRPALPRGVDEGGRALWGEPTRIGSWLGGAPGTLGRFDRFGPIWELDQGGWSEYLGVTFRLRGGAAPRLHWSAEYTWSRTEDNLPGLGTIGRLAGVPLEAEQDEDVSDGVSDLDRPHRAVLTVGIPLPIEGSYLSGVYRFQSGAAFTPGYVPGVDANMDGVLGNDPAFVSTAAESAHGGDWDCLGSDIGGFATRNGCRGPDLHSLDLRLSLEVSSLGASVFVDALNVLDREHALLDTGLWAVDEGAGITRQASTVQLPLMINPNFGSPVRDLSTGRILRVGVRIGR